MHGLAYTQKSCAGVWFAGQLSIRKEQFMQNKQEQNRVLGRVGARLLGQEELNAVSGGFATALCSLQPNTPNLDGDCHFGS